MISITDLWKSFGTTPVLRGVSLEVTAGQVSVLLGGSGSGKSTLLRMINGLETFDKGTVTVNGTALPGNAGPERDAALLKIRRSVGMVFQKFHLFPHLTVLQNVIEAPVHVLKMSVPEATAVARQLLDRVGMGFKADAMPAALSGGQQQRVALARAIVIEPQVLLLDEPLSNLDARLRLEMRSEIRRICREAGLTALNVSLDSLQPARFAAITGHDRFDEVMDGILYTAAASLGFAMLENVLYVVPLPPDLPGGMRVRQLVVLMLTAVGVALIGRGWSGRPAEVSPRALGATVAGARAAATAGFSKAVIDVTPPAGIRVGVDGGRPASTRICEPARVAVCVVPWPETVIESP